MKAATKKLLMVVLSLSVICSNLVISKPTSAKIVGKKTKVADVQDMAIPLKMDGQWSTDYWMTKEYNTHYYKIVIPMDGYFSFKIMSYIGAGCEFDLYSSNLSEKYWGGGYLNGCGTGRGTENSPATGSRYTSLSGGTYILKISSSEEGRYKLWSTYTNYQVNDSNAISYDAPQDFIEGSTIIGALTETDNEDWYRIRINRTGYYTFSWESYVNYRGGNGATCRLYSSDLLSEILKKELYGASESRPITWKEDIALSAGTYYIKIDASIGLFGNWVAAGKYTIKWDAIKQENCNHSYKKNLVLPSYLSKGYTLHQCEKCGKSYKDNYIAKKKLGQSQISMYSRGGKGRLYLQWYIVSDATGYQIRYCKSKIMKKGVKVKTINGRTKSKKTIKKLSRKRKYYVQVRAYKKIGPNIVYGKWSAKKCVKTK